MEKKERKNPIWLSQLKQPQSAAMFVCKYTCTRMCVLQFDDQIWLNNSFYSFEGFLMFAEPSPQSLPTFTCFLRPIYSCSYISLLEGVVF